MGKGRLEAFSDGVIAILITIMVLELKVPVGQDLAALGASSSTLASYLMSFVFVGIYWNNHHHLFHAVHKVTGGTLWANLALLFFLSLIPFTTAWMGETHFARIPVTIYGVSILAPAIAYTILTRVLLASHGEHSTLARAIGDDRKGRASLAIYLAGIALSYFASPWLGVACYATVSLIWLVPDKRIERAMGHTE